MPKLSCIDSTWNTATRPLILQHVKAGVQSPAWAFLGWQSLQQHQGTAPGRESLVPHPRHIWFWSFWVFHIVYHMEYVFIYTILVYIGIFSQYVWIHVSPWQRQGIEGSARGILEINHLWHTEKGDAVPLSFQGYTGRCDGNPEITCPLGSSAAFSLSVFVTDQQGCFQDKMALVFLSLLHFFITFLDC